MITDQDVRYVAALSRIHLREEEVDRLRKNLEDILRYIEKLNQLDVSAVEPTNHVLPLKNVLRPDDARPSLTQEEALSIAVEKSQGAFKVPKVIE
ncbi:MAG: Asp-tRNA(Asn)/Glu-tRNA(Gln) amidotransferase subunit GatC [Candidatus Omnitrophica bacterium]|nr:Asp-tRNA(Asn)/Glu-tRNA(Gln) amidotransferase subunit GatC [Candidatus Omnitrophota bacterium]